ncbi:Thioredoxin [Arboricoccus pini]|uniref:Thioredoxin n=1 Tax=Arboricoccus pini TaxID=1963835 RepID=A0A212RRU3_9PROT|nr:thioredoxin family protein [Arboricoccus pini]SNB75293.1 Thioredoxin [Arboricoccus pini]
MESAVPGFFTHFAMRPVSSANLEEILAEPNAPRYAILFLWGRNCPNCEVAKRALMQQPERFQWQDVRWLHANVYDDLDMATRFGLHGIPTFFLFKGARKVGRITSWPGISEFIAGIDRQLTQPLS